MNTLQKEISCQTHIKGNFRAHSDGVYKIKGSLLGSLTLDKNSIVELSGIIEGDIFNNGGILHVFGTVIGKIFNNGGQTFIDSKANVIPIENFILTL